jgi:hypothetical protein
MNTTKSFESENLADPLNNGQSFGVPFSWLEFSRVQFLAILAKNSCGRAPVYKKELSHG